MATSLTAAAFLPLLLVVNIYCWNEGAVLLRDVQVLTLYRGRYTTARRSSPVPQLQCVGGSAGCGAFAPEVVQCQNKGWDGVDAQWECKADMDNAYRFGRVEVSCEGFNHPDDAYVLTGSCGLEYTLELTAEGQQQRSRSSRSSHGSAGFSDFASSFFGGSPGGGQRSSGAGQAFQSSSGEGIGGLVGIGLLLLLAYGVYKMFLCNPTHGHERFPDDDSARGAWQGGAGHMGPPPPGFKPDYTDHPGSFSGPNPGYGFANEFTRPRHNAPRGGNGFWTGMGTGGVLGYLFGSQSRQRGMGPTWGSGSSFTPRTSAPPPSSASTGTRTASGFGGTKRR